MVNLEILFFSVHCDSSFSGGDHRKLSTKFSGEIIPRNKQLGLHEYKFLLKTIVSSDIGEETYVPQMVFDGRESPTLSDGLLEMDEFFLDSIPALLRRTAVPPSDIDLLVVNISMLSSAPSPAARIINLYNLRHDVKVYNLAGMGCSASTIAINIIENIFKMQANSTAMVVTSKSLNPNWYMGNDTLKCSQTASSAPADAPSSSPTSRLYRKRRCSS
ncbi:3-ketoacyl-CoA synthase 12-like [Salvia hispanica]|uniref:3-ketoacyl-CoA synthase 12-like n=1 Tax=Salvia hispanica TaxID=49212 RepID=UPI0020091682|nr:3-ketoacyl-CoA synthase 12-like [Salvia hispanica]